MTSARDVRHLNMGSRIAPLMLVSLLMAACATSTPTLSVAQKAEIRSLDPAIGYDIYAWPWERLMFETLITYDEGTGLVPRLAEALPEVSDEGRTFTFTIRDGVSFVKADGTVLREVEADDFVYSLNRLLNPNLTPSPSPVATSFFAIIDGADDVLEGRATEASGLTAPDARTFRVTLTTADPTILNILAMPFGSVVPRELAGTDTAAFSEHPVGTGPYLLAEWLPSQRARFVINKHYWNSEAGRPPEIVVDLGVDPATQLQRVEAGTLDVMTDAIPAGEFNDTIADARWAEYIQRSGRIITNFLAMDTASDGPLGQVLVRQAISHAIDRDNIVRIKNGRAVAGACIYPPLLPPYDPACNPYPYDVARARDLMRQANLEEGFATRLFTDEVEPDRSVAQAIQQDLAEIGIEAEIVPQEATALYESIFAHATPLVYTGWVMDFPDPADFTEPVLTCRSRGGYNSAWYCNEAVDAMVDAARAERDAAQRLDLFAQIERQIMADAPWVPTDYPETVVLVSPQVGNFALHPVWSFDFERYRIAQ